MLTDGALEVVVEPVGDPAGHVLGGRVRAAGLELTGRGRTGVAAVDPDHLDRRALRLQRPVVRDALVEVEQGVALALDDERRRLDLRACSWSRTRAAAGRSGRSSGCRWCAAYTSVGHTKVGEVRAAEQASGVGRGVLHAVDGAEPEEAERPDRLGRRRACWC